MKMQLEVVAQRGAVKREASTELTVLVRITPPQVETKRERPSLNVGLVLDRSGSMSGSKLKAAKEAAQYAVTQLLPRDRISITIYDDSVETVVHSTLAGDKEAIQRAIRGVATGGSTALHNGWLEGATQVSRHLNTEQLNRVLLLTDGLANVGETDPEKICKHVRALAARGVSTSALGVGSDFNEDLLQAMANSGDGNYQFIEGAGDLERIFAAEFHGLMATLGQKVSLGIEPQRGCEEQDVLNELERNKRGRLMLPNLVAGNPVDVVLTLNVPPQRDAIDVGEEREICQFRLAWNAPDGERQMMRVALQLPVVGVQEWETLSENSQVKEAAALLEIGRLQTQAAQAVEAGDYERARSITRDGVTLAESALPAPAAAREVSAMGRFDEMLEEGDVETAKKSLKFGAYLKARSRKS